MKIVVTGSNGMVGHCIQDRIVDYSDHEFTFLHRKGGIHSVDLTNKEHVAQYFSNHSYDSIIHLAANVGGLYKNMAKNIQMFQDNMNMTMNVLEACHANNIQRGIFVLSSCIYPANPSRFPMDETMIHEGPPHNSNEGYAYAKRMMEMLCKHYNETYNREYICVIPVNLYGPYDNFDLEDGHMVPMIMHRFYYTRSNPIAYGTGLPLRQFLFAPDFANMICTLLFTYNDTTPIICCNHDEYEIKDIVKEICNVMDIPLQSLTWDNTKSDGCMRKTVTNAKFHTLYPDFQFTSLHHGLQQTYTWFLQHIIDT